MLEEALRPFERADAHEKASQGQKKALSSCCSAEAKHWLSQPEFASFDGQISSFSGCCWACSPLLNRLSKDESTTKGASPAAAGKGGRPNRQFPGRWIHAAEPELKPSDDRVFQKQAVFR